MKPWEAAVLVLEKTGNPAVMWGDSGLLHMIAGELGWEHHAWRTEKRVLDALSRDPGILVPKKTMTGRNRRVRIFRLPEEQS